MSIVRHIIDLQRGMGKQNVGSRREVITKSLITSPCREFVVTDQLVNRGPNNNFTFMDCGRIFHQQAKKRMVVCSNAFPSRTAVTKRLNQKNFHHKQFFNFQCNVKCNDLVLLPVAPAAITPALLRKEPHSILFLEHKRFLTRLSCETGKVKEKVFLSNSVSFEQIHFHPKSGLIGLKSNRCTNERDSHLFTVAIFSSAPLKFRCMFEVKSSTFGQLIKSVEIMEGLIFVHTAKETNMYSLEYILRECIETIVDDMTEKERSRIGKHPHSLPMNAQFGNDHRRALFTLSSFQSELIVSPHPWRFLMKKKSDKAEVWNLSAKKAIGEIKFPSQFAGMELDSVSFSGSLNDNSNRILYLCNSKLEIYTVYEGRISLCMTYNAEAPGLARPLAHGNYTTTRSGRVVRQAANMDPIGSNLNVTHNISVAVDRDTSIMAIMSVAAKGPDQVTLKTLKLVDSSPYNVLKKVKLDKMIAGSIFDMSCNLTLEGVQLFAEVHNGDCLKGFVISLIEIL